MPVSSDVDSDGYVQFPNVDPGIENLNAGQTAKSYSVVARILTRFDPTFLDVNANVKHPRQYTTLTAVAAGGADDNAAIEQVLSSIIGKFPGVTAARVMIKRSKDKLSDKANPPTATIVMTTAKTDQRPQSLIAPAVSAVANAVSGLTPQNVSVILNGVSYHSSDSASQ